MKTDGTEVGVLKALQKDGESVTEADSGTELAASIDGAVIGRNLKEGDVLLVSVPESAARAFKSQALDPSEMAILDEVAKIHRTSQPFWGQ
jgi:translation initiation factor IF-2